MLKIKTPETFKLLISDGVGGVRWLHWTSHVYNIYILYFSVIKAADSSFNIVNASPYKQNSYTIILTRSELTHEICTRPNLSTAGKDVTQPTKSTNFFDLARPNPKWTVAWVNI